MSGKSYKSPGAFFFQGQLLSSRFAHEPSEAWVRDPRNNPHMTGLGGHNSCKNEGVRRILPYSAQLANIVMTVVVAAPTLRALHVMQP